MTHKLLYFLVITIHCFSAHGQTVDADTLKTVTKEVALPYSIQKIEPLIIKEVIGDNVGEILKTMSPNFIKTVGPGGIAAISLRGGSAWQTQVFWEGIAINSPTLGQSDLSLLPFEFYSGISIYNTGASSRVGQGGIAGSVALQSTGRSSYGGNVHFEKEYGNFGLDHTSAKLSLAKDSKLFSETVLFKKYAQNNFKYLDYSSLDRPILERTNSAFNQLGGQQNLQVRIKEGWLKMIASFVETDRNIPSAIGVQDQLQIQKDQNYKALIQYKKSKAVHEYGADHRDFTHVATLGWIYDIQKYQHPNALINANYFNTTYSAQFHSTYELKNKLVINTQINEYLYKAISDGFAHQIFQNRLSLSGVGSKTWKSAYLNLSIQELLIDTELSLPISNLGGYALFDLLGKTQSFYGNIGTNYRHPSLNDLYWSVGGNQDLQPESSFNYELGVKTFESNYKSKLNYDLVYFQDYVDNWIQWVPDASGIWKPQNVKSVNKRGIDASLEYKKRVKYLQYLLISSNYRWVNTKVIRTEFPAAQIGKELIYTPRHIVNIYAALKLLRFTFRYNQTITSKFYLDSDNKTYLPYSAPADLTLKYRFDETEEANTSHLSLEFTIHNIWGEDYQVVANQPMPGRWFSFKLTYNLHNRDFGKPAN